MEPDSLFDKAQQFLRSAAVLFELEDFDSCASRAYFAMFFSAQALLTADGQRHAGRRSARTAFVERYVEGGELPKRAGEAFAEAQQLQEIADFGGKLAVSEQQAERVLQEAEAFVHSLQTLVEQRGGAPHEPEEVNKDDATG